MTLLKFRFMLLFCLVVVTAASVAPAIYASQTFKCVDCASDHVCELFGSECWTRGTGEEAAISCEDGRGMCTKIANEQCGAKLAHIPLLGCKLPVGGCGGPHCFDWNLGF